MSKYNHFEMCEKIFGSKYKYDENKQAEVMYTRTDMWDKLLELQKENKQLKEQFAIRNKALELACVELCYGKVIDLSYREEYFIEQAKESLK